MKSIRYRYKGNIYYIVDEVKMKHPVTREWVEAIIYAKDDESSDMYCREAVEFYERFKPI